MKKTKTKTISVAELAAFSNLTGRRIRQLAEEGKIPPNKRGKLAMPAAVQMLFAHYQKDSEELTKERLALVAVNRKTKEHELAEAEGKFIARDMASATIRAVANGYHNFVKRHIETHSPTHRLELLRHLGASPELCAKFHEADLQNSQSVVDSIEAECAKVSEVKL